MMLWVYAEYSGECEYSGGLVRGGAGQQNPEMDNRAQRGMPYFMLHTY